MTVFWARAQNKMIRKKENKQGEMCKSRIGGRNLEQATPLVDKCIIHSISHFTTTFHLAEMKAKSSQMRNDTKMQSSGF